jgi:hypothetical protein
MSIPVPDLVMIRLIPLVPGISSIGVSSMVKT